MPIPAPRRSRRALLMALAVAATASGLAGLSGCTSSVDRRPAEAAVQAFHARLDAGQYDAIYAEAADDLRAGASRQAVADQLAAVHARLGATRTWQPLRWHLSFGMKSALLTMDYATTYAAGAATEQFVYRMTGNEARLVSWRLKARALDAQL